MCFGDRVEMAVSTLVWRGIERGEMMGIRLQSGFRMSDKELLGSCKHSP